MCEKQFLNIAGYYFFTIEEPEKWQQPLKEFCENMDLKGSILLGKEGINLYVCGIVESMEKFKNHLHQNLQIPNIEYKESWSSSQPFQRMLVKVKKEIVTMGHQNINVPKETGPHISPKKFKEWLDNKKEINVLDVRNKYEINYGKFENALDLNVSSFVEFAQKAKDIDTKIKEKPLVMYCTGGIRCEKASALLLKEYGFKEVYQLEGGILNYFKECGKEHYEGECFVFDERITVDALTKN